MWKGGDTLTDFNGQHRRPCSLGVGIQSRHSRACPGHWQQTALPSRLAAQRHMTVTCHPTGAAQGQSGSTPRVTHSRQQLAHPVSTSLAVRAHPLLGVCLTGTPGTHGTSWKDPQTHPGTAKEWPPNLGDPGPQPPCSNPKPERPLPPEIECAGGRRARWTLLCPHCLH